MAYPRWTRVSLLSLVLLSTPGLVAGQVAVGTTSDFEDGTTQGWVINLLGMGGPVPQPMNVPTGGPGGAGDSYLQLVSTGQAGPGGRLTAINFMGAWSGDYVAAGVTAIRMDVRNEGPTDLYLRLLISDPVAGPPTNSALSFSPIFLPAGGDWRSVVFPFYGPGGLVAPPGAGTVEGALRNATELRILHGQTLGFPPDPILAQLGVDNITATVTPEPGTVLLVGTGLLALVGVARRRPRAV